ncbi:MAG TPA: carbohydrate-binding protein [Anaerohalosphaeraceae bacterium]|nr:carbohydrate-binding protein [Anaerohalosphaeraceae bacterium]HOL88601.1 carbohydrate-binding protein [Anaerohalosphaeraceae bacterium]HPP56251.1 carbohydrate-binding protein [Anaerohalosphaeraceae bacterium]
MKKIVLVFLIIVSGAASRGADGFGQNTTGGAGGTTVVVSTPAELKTYAETVNTPYIIQVSGTLDLASIGGKISIQSNKTIEGTRTNPTIIGMLGFKNGSSNVIIRRLTIRCPQGYGEGNGIAVKEDITNVFITKCTIYDCYDGLVDITRRSDNITVSWCKFYFTQPMNEQRVSLVGSSDSATDDYGKLRITYHHNWFGAMCKQRIPSVRFGKVHLYNNYYHCTGVQTIYGVWARLYSECLIENNYFKEVNNPYYNIEYDNTVKGRIAASGNILDNCTGTVHPGTDSVFTPPYAYNLDAASMVPAIVQWGAGADGKDGYPPHWMFGMYGDFDLNGLVDHKDFAVFAGFWKAVSGIENADYYPNGVIDLEELALFVSNWLYIPPDTTPPAAPANLRATGRNAQVYLQWDDNSEQDLAGYNIYRSTSWDTGYVKLNAAPLSASEYTDETVVNGMMYYYVVSAVDNNHNESVYSAQACAVPDDASDSIIIQENPTLTIAGLCVVNGIVDTEEHPGYTGYGYCDTTNAAGSGINWKISLSESGTYTFTWRFANGSTARPARLLINGIEASAGIDFPATGAWENYTTVSIELSLTAGPKEIRLEALTSGGCANIDYFKVSGPSPEIAVCN